MKEQYVIGIDFGSDSVRAVVAAAASGRVVGTGEASYPRWRKGLYQHPGEGIFRQHPRDYLEALEACVKAALAELSEPQKQAVAAIGVDTTGSTPVPVDCAGVPLSMRPEFDQCENAMFHLWKDHSAALEARELDALFMGGSSVDYSRYQGKYCAEWFWAKILHTVREDDRIRAAAYTWLEHCDWIVGVLCGNTRPETIYHSACAAGHKALWHSQWEGLPDAAVLALADPYLQQVRERYGRPPEPATTAVGVITKGWAQKLGLSRQVRIAGSSFDAHAGAVGAGIKEKTMVCSIGTSAVDMLIARASYLRDKDIRDYGGQAEDSVLPGYVGIETGQAAFGDVFAWFKRLLMWPVEQTRPFLKESEYVRLCQQMEAAMLDQLQQQAAGLSDQEFSIALEWFNGRRYPRTDDSQKGVLANLSLGSGAPELFRALVFGAACGMKRIISGFEAAGIEIEQLIAVGGIPRKSDYIMQMLADVLGKAIEVSDSDQTSAVGAAIYAAVAGGIWPDAETAVQHMAAGRLRTFIPDQRQRKRYEKHCKEYLRVAAAAEQPVK